ncbi:hypothetical protein HDU93_008463 [Gonapodya sp. JEL0774]|nr:hypothetical protein HDU93_008463 [Gonapodya sp. JEL0774]
MGVMLLIGYDYGRDQGGPQRDREGGEGPRPIQQARRSRNVDEGNSSSPTDLWDMPGEGAGSFGADGSFKVGSAEKRISTQPSWKARLFEDGDVISKVSEHLLFCWSGVSYSIKHVPVPQAAGRSETLSESAPSREAIFPPGPLKEGTTEAVSGSGEGTSVKPLGKPTNAQGLAPLPAHPWIDAVTGPLTRSTGPTLSTGDLLRGIGDSFGLDAINSDPFRVTGAVQPQQPDLAAVPSFDVGTSSSTPSTYLSTFSGNAIGGLGVNPTTRPYDPGFGLGGGMGLGSTRPVTSSFPYSSAADTGLVSGFNPGTGGLSQPGFSRAALNAGLAEPLLQRELAALRGLSHVTAPLFLLRFGTDRPFILDAEEYINGEPLTSSTAIMGSTATSSSTSGLSALNHRRDQTAFDPFSPQTFATAGTANGLGNLSSGISSVTGLGIGGGVQHRTGATYGGTDGSFNPLATVGLTNLGIGVDVIGSHSRGAGTGGPLGLNHESSGWPGEPSSGVSRVGSASVAWDNIPAIGTRAASSQSIVDQFGTGFPQPLAGAAQKSPPRSQASFNGTSMSVASSVNQQAPLPDRWSFFGQSPIARPSQQTTTDLSIQQQYSALSYGHESPASVNGVEEDVHSEQPLSEDVLEDLVVELSSQDHPGGHADHHVLVVSPDPEQTMENSGFHTEGEAKQRHQEGLPASSSTTSKDSRKKKKESRKTAAPQEKPVLSDTEKKESDKKAWKSGGGHQISFRELQEREALEREKERKRLEQLKEEQLAAAVAAVRAQEQLQQEADGNGLTPWAAAAAPAKTLKKKSLQEIMAEEERVKNAKEAAREAQKQAAVASAVAVGIAQAAASESWSSGNRYANIAQATPRAGPAPAWAKVPASGPSSGLASSTKPAVVVAPPMLTKAAVQTKGATTIVAPKVSQPLESPVQSWTTVGKSASAAPAAPVRAVPRSPPAPQRSTPAVQPTVAQPSALTSQTSYVGKEIFFGLSEEFAKWIRQTLRPVSKDINVEDFVGILLSFQVGEFSTVADVCADTLSFTTAIDPRKFALEFVNRRRAEGTGGTGAGSGNTSRAGSSSGLLDGMDSGNKFVPVKSTAGKKKKK